MSEPSHVSLDKLREEAAAFAADPYLITVTTDHRPHCGVVSVDWDSLPGQLVVRAPSHWIGSKEHGLRDLSLLWPPPEPAGYSLIVDGVADAFDQHGDGAEEEQVAITPTRAVLHRRGSPRDEASSCGSDCVPIFSS